MIVVISSSTIGITPYEKDGRAAYYHDEVVVEANMFCSSQIY